MDFSTARRFLYKNARPLDIARWKFHFENGSREDVLTALAAYQNADGGFAGGLEADCWNTCSSPMQTWVATRIIGEVGLRDRAHPLIAGILRYLDSGRDFNGHVWGRTVPTNNNFPAAQWWAHDEREAYASYNPTASLAGFLLRFAPAGSGLREKAAAIAREALAYFEKNYPLDAAHTASCYLELYEDMAALAAGGGPGAAQVAAIGDLSAFQALLKRQIDFSLTRDTAAWATDYVYRPSFFLRDKRSPFCAGNEALCAFECDYIDKTQQADGAWQVNWAWADYPEEWHIARNWWKADIVIKYALFRRAFGS